MRTRHPFSAMLAAMAFAAGISLSWSQAFEGASSGTIESVREVLVETVEAGIPGLFEHALGPGDEVVVRLDDGQLFTTVQNEVPRFEPGQRVVVLASKSGARVQPASTKFTFD